MRVSFQPGKAVLCLIGFHPCAVFLVDGIPAVNPSG
jgi:hypothetical protein